MDIKKLLDARGFPVVFVLDDTHIYRAKINTMRTEPHGFNSKTNKVNMDISIDHVMVDNTLAFITEILTMAKNTSEFQCDGDAVEQIGSILTAIKL